LWYCRRDSKDGTGAVILEMQAVMEDLEFLLNLVAMRMAKSWTFLEAKKAAPDLAIMG